MNHAPFLFLLQKALGHALPNQLIAINGLAKLLELEAGDRLGEAREYLDRLNAAGLRCHQFVKELADAVRLLNLPQAEEMTSLAEVVRDSVEELRPRFPNLRMQMSFAEDALAVRVAGSILRYAVGQVLRNVAEADASSPIQVRSRSSPGGMVLEIVAGGTHVGLTQRRSQELDPKLALAASVLACHGGRLEVESLESHETVLRLHLPGRLETA